MTSKPTRWHTWYSCGLDYGCFIFMQLSGTHTCKRNDNLPVRFLFFLWIMCGVRLSVCFLICLLSKGIGERYGGFHFVLFI